MLSWMGKDSPTGMASRTPPHSRASGTPSLAEVMAHDADSIAFLA